MSGNADELKFDTLKLDGGASNGKRMLHVQLASPAIWSISLRKGEFSAIKGAISLEDAALPGGRFAFPMIGRSEERRVGNECVSKCRSRWSPDHYKQTI